jgi:hypothetical protein
VLAIEGVTYIYSQIDSLSILGFVTLVELEGVT